MSHPPTSKMLRLSTWPLQLANNSITFPGITHSTPERQNIETHYSLATSQWRRSMDSPLILHIQDQSNTMTFIFLKLSKVKILPKGTANTKNATLEGALPLQVLFQGNRVKGSHFKLEKRWSLFHRDMSWALC